MIIDLNDLDDNALLQGDVAIIGAGAAGITIAHELLNSGLQVLLLESGGLEYEDESQNLYQGDVIGVGNTDVGYSRLRYFGGTTNHWSGQCSPLDEIDFEARPGIPHSGWPFAKAHLDPFYARAQKYCELGPYEYDDDYWAKLSGNEAWDTEGSPLESAVFQYSPPTRFGQKYRKALQDAENVAVYLHANAVNFVTEGEDKSVTAVKLQSLGGKHAEARAKVFILACGGLENPRVLLNARDKNPKGMGNANDLVGRFFMDHMNIRSGLIKPLDPHIPIAFYDNEQRYKNTLINGCIKLSKQAMLAHELLNLSAFLMPQPVNKTFRNQDIESPGVFAFTAMAKDMMRGKVTRNFGAKTCVVVNDADNVITMVYRRALRPFQDSGGTDHMIVHQEAEQLPNPDSRVLLTEEKDALGLNRIALDWQLTRKDKESIVKTHEIMGRALGMANLARFKIEMQADDDFSEMQTAWHHMGTTRMHEDPTQGAVDSDAKLHDIDNFYIAGSSVFPTVGTANPTLTIVALSIRLADHVKQRVGGA